MAKEQSTDAEPVVKKAALDTSFAVNKLKLMRAIKETTKDGVVPTTEEVQARYVVLGGLLSNDAPQFEITERNGRAVKKRVK